MGSLLESLPSIALGLFLALRCGRRAQGWGLPRVTAYLLVGILLGPHLLGRLITPGTPGAVLLIGPASQELLALAEQAPRTRAGLQRVRGLGKKKAERYGAAVL